MTRGTMIHDTAIRNAQNISSEQSPSKTWQQWVGSEALFRRWLGILITPPNESPHLLAHDGSAENMFPQPSFSINSPFGNKSQPGPRATREMASAWRSRDLRITQAYGSLCHNRTNAPRVIALTAAVENSSELRRNMNHVLSFGASAPSFKTPGTLPDVESSS